MAGKQVLSIGVASLAALALLSCGQAPPASEDERTLEEVSGRDVETQEAIFCAEIERRIGVQECDDLTTLADRAALGAAAFNTPNPMRLGEAHTLQLAISFAPSPEPETPDDVLDVQEAAPSEGEAPLDATSDVGGEFGAGAEARAVEDRPSLSSPPPPSVSETVDALPGETVEYAPIVGRSMRAELSGAGFDITPLSPASQGVFEDSVTTWEWQVIARTGGARSLTLKTYVEYCNAEGECEQLRSTTHNHQVEVTVGLMGRLQAFLGGSIWRQLLVGAMGAGLALAAWLGMRAVFRKKEAVFISYRRDDTADVAGRISDAMARAFGRKRVFKDVDNLRAGENFGDQIRAVLPRCNVALILIGPGWLDAQDPSDGARRLDDPNDWVRTEIEIALNTPSLDVVPVLVNGAQMPRAGDIPECLRPLLERHAAIVRRDPDFADDITRLRKALRASVGSGSADVASRYDQGAV